MKNAGLCKILKKVFFFLSHYQNENIKISKIIKILTVKYNNIREVIIVH